MKDDATSSLEPPTTSSPIVQVAVTAMPDKESKGFFRDTSRLLSVAAFIFSVTTGTLAAYQTWRSSRESIADTTSKLVEQYYAIQEKFSKLENHQTAYANLLGSQARSAALRAAISAERVSSLIDEGIWQAIAQINMNEDNFRASESAWIYSLKYTTSVDQFFFSLRQLSNLYYKADRINQAETVNLLAITLNDRSIIRSDDISGVSMLDGRPLRISRADLPYDSPRSKKAIQAFIGHQLWLESHSTFSCESYAPHFDSSVILLNEAEAFTPKEDVPRTVQIAEFKGQMWLLSERRSRCAETPPSKQVESDCYLLGIILDSSGNGFTSLRGPPTDPTSTSSAEFETIFTWPDGQCQIDARSYTCSFPDSSQNGTIARQLQIVQDLQACPNFNILQVSQTSSSSSRIDSFNTIIQISDRPSVVVNRRLSKPTSTRPQPTWSVDLSIFSTRRR